MTWLSKRCSCFLLHQSNFLILSALKIDDFQLGRKLWIENVSLITFDGTMLSWIDTSAIMLSCERKRCVRRWKFALNLVVSRMLVCACLADTNRNPPSSNIKSLLAKHLNLPPSDFTVESVAGKKSWSPSHQVDLRWEVANKKTTLWSHDVPPCTWISNATATAWKEFKLLNKRRNYRRNTWQEWLTRQPRSSL